jgi:hypothetical protein
VRVRQDSQRYSRAVLRSQHWMKMGQQYHAWWAQGAKREALDSQLPHHFARYKWDYCDFKKVVAHIMTLSTPNAIRRSNPLASSSGLNWKGPEKELFSVKSQMILIGRCQTQNWPGICAALFGSFGRGVVTTQRFQKNDLIMDYHGKIVENIKYAEYEKEVGPDAMNYVMDVMQGTNKRLIDASEEICPDHPTNFCLPRLANHVTQKDQNNLANLKPVEVVLHDKTHVVVLRARFDIEPFVQLRYDYGDENARNAFTE